MQFNAATKTDVVALANTKGTAARAGLLVSCLAFLFFELYFMAIRINHQK